MRKGQKMTEASRKKLSEARKGMKFSEEHIRHMSESRRGEKHHNWGKKLPESTRAKMRGPKTEEHKRKIKEGHARYWKGKLGRFSVNNPVEYKAIHHQVNRLYKKPTCCENCGIQAREFKKGLHWANMDGKYNIMNRFSWRALCPKCHRQYDIDFYNKSVIA